MADLLQHINLMKTSDSYGFKEEYEVRLGRAGDAETTEKRIAKLQAYDEKTVRRSVRVCPVCLICSDRVHGKGEIKADIFAFFAYGLKDV